MDISVYFSPIDIEKIEVQQDSIAHYTDFHSHLRFPTLDDADIAIFGVLDSRGSSENHDQGPDAIRKAFYPLFHHKQEIRIVDLGNIQKGATQQDTYHAIADVVFELNKKSVVALILGGSQDLTFGNYLAYQKLEQTVNLAVIDSKIDLVQEDRDGITSDDYLSKIIVHQPDYLFNFSAIGYQTYLVAPTINEFMQELYFDTHRLGVLQSDITRGESVLRNADMISVDVGVIRQSECIGKKEAEPNGFYGEEICQLMRYAGMSDKLSSIGMYEFMPQKDASGASAKLLGQMLWCFIDGYCSRKNDYPAGLKDEYIKYKIHVENTAHELVFYKSDKSDRWWMHIPYPPHKFVKFERHHLVPCNYEDYQNASRGHIPDIWWQTYQKLN